MMLDEPELGILQDRLEGWELIEFLGVPMDELLRVAIENDWINDDNVHSLLDLVIGEE